jgi:nucleotide-binding universal stress UspA family protein
MTTSKIVVGVDGSEHSARAVKWCADHAGPLDAEVVVVHAVDVPMLSGSPFELLPVAALSSEQRDELRDIVTRDWCKPLADAGAGYRVRLVDGPPALALMQVVDEENAELLVTGRRGRGGFAELVLGSTSHALTHHFNRPLLIVP